MRSVLLNYAKRVNEKNYFDNVVYDRDRNISVYRKDNEDVPLIEASSVNMGIMTKTEAAREKDDTFPFVIATQTKTFSSPESDDQCFNNY